LSDVFDFKNDPALNHLITVIEKVAQKHLSRIVRLMLAWRSSQQPHADKLRDRLYI
jgi:hypothetical protein